MVWCGVESLLTSHVELLFWLHALVLVWSVFVVEKGKGGKTDKSKISISGVALDT